MINNLAAWLGFCGKMSCICRGNIYSLLIAKCLLWALALTRTALCMISLSLGVPCMLKNVTCLPHSSMRTLMRSTVLIFYENTTLLCCISLTLASVNPRLSNSIFLCWIFHLPLSRGNFINSLLWRLAYVVPPMAQLMGWKNEKMGKS